MYLNFRYEKCGRQYQNKNDERCKKHEESCNREAQCTHDYILDLVEERKLGFITKYRELSDAVIATKPDCPIGYSSELVYSDPVRNRELPKTHFNYAQMEFLVFIHGLGEKNKAKKLTPEKGARLMRLVGTAEGAAMMPHEEYMTASDTGCRKFSYKELLLVDQIRSQMSRKHAELVSSMIKVQGVSAVTVPAGAPSDQLISEVSRQPSGEMNDNDIAHHQGEDVAVQNEMEDVVVQNEVEDDVVYDDHEIDKGMLSCYCRGTVIDDNDTVCCCHCDKKFHTKCVQMSCQHEYMCYKCMFYSQMK